MKNNKLSQPGIVYVWFVILSVQSCTTIPYYDPPTAADLHAWNQRESVLNTISNWELSGRIVIKTNNEGWNGQIQWHQSPSDYHLIFSTPLGQGAMKLIGTVSEATITLPDQKTYTSEDADSLILDYTGWNLPLNNVKYWVIGRPAPGQDKSLKLDTQGRLVALLQSEWEVHFKRYSSVGTIQVPDKIYFNNHEISVRLVVDSWKIQH